MSTPTLPLTLWYNHPAPNWNEALPLGNGSLGAMVFGGLPTERIQLNHDTLWSGPPLYGEGNDPLAPSRLAGIREAAFAGKFAEASQRCRQIQGPFSQAYMPMADLWIEFTAPSTLPSEYRHSLNLTDATDRVAHRHAVTTVKRRAFVSHPDQILVWTCESDKDCPLSGLIRLNSPHPFARPVQGVTTLAIAGRAPVHAEPNYLNAPHPIIYDSERGLRFHVSLTVSATGGRLRATDKGIAFTGATGLTIRLSAATDFRAKQDPTVKTAAILKKAQRYSDVQLHARHVIDHRRLFDRVKLELDAPHLDKPTDQRIIDFPTTQDAGLFELLFQFGRYLMIAGSRAGTQALNLQGIWNESLVPPWSSNYTTNINTQMNYWPVESAGLSECHGPLFDLIEEAAVNGRRTAAIHYGVSGWVMHHNTDLWRKTAPVGRWRGEPMWANWPMGGAWLCRHLWERYLHTGDRAFLIRYYPILRDAAEFCLAWLIEDPKGRLVTCPSISPENRFTTADGSTSDVSIATTMDISIIRELFAYVAEAGKILKRDAPFGKKLRAAARRLPPFQVGREGELMEWSHETTDPEPTHRHISHLYGLYPSNLITPDATPELAEACRVTLNRRGDPSTGWSMAWKVCCWARLRDGDRAYKVLCQMLTMTREGDVQYSDGGVYPNMFGAHPPFQIDSNFGAVAGIAEMLLQSHAGEIHLLPALPSAWPSGRVEGLRARGGVTISLNWEKGRLISCTATSDATQTVTVRYGNTRRRVNLTTRQQRCLSDLS